MIKGAAFVGLLVVLMSGCATARLSSGPLTSALTDYVSPVRAGIAEVADARGTDHAGTIGALGVKIKSEDLSLLATNYLVDSVNRQMQVNVERVGNASLTAAGPGTDYLMKAKVTELKMKSFDSLMQPVEVDCSLELEVYDPSGASKLSRSYQGHYQERVGIAVMDKATGKLAERAVQDAMWNLVKDPELKRLFQK